MHKTCNFCDKEFKTWTNRQKFCSRKCSTDSYKKNYSGIKSPNYGVKKSELARKHITEAKLGQRNPMFGKKPWNTGMPHSEETKNKISVTKKILLSSGVIKLWNKGIKTGQNVWNKGLTKSADDRVAKNAEKARRTRLERLKDPVYREKHVSKLSESHKKYYREHPEALLKFKEVRSKIVYPKKDSKIEKKVQEALKSAGISFVTHYPFYNKICETRIDIALPERKLAVYCDGDYWHNIPSYKERDARIVKGLEIDGWRVLRFWEHEINSNVNACVDKILNVVNNG